MADEWDAKALPCPFCGGEADFGEVTNPDDGSFGGHYIACKKCWAMSRLQFACGDDPKPLLIEAWNSRDDTAAERRGIERAAKWHDERASAFRTDAAVVRDECSKGMLIAAASAHERDGTAIHALAPPMADAGPTEPAGASDREGT